MRHALIVGGSSSGPFVGLSLRQAGWNVTVFGERWRSSVVA